MTGDGLISHKGKRRLISRSSVKASNKVKSARLNLLELPLDIIFEIFSHLEPLDLLQALETCKALHKLLAGVTSRVIWSRARANIQGLPDCPDDLSEVEYARLSFESHCQACHQGKSYELRTVRVWAARARYCPDCFDANFIQEKVGRKRKELYPDELKKLLPRTLGWHRHLSVCRSLDELWGKEYKRLKTDPERGRWTTTKVTERKKINAHAALCEAWFESWEKEKIQRRKRQIEGRKAKIMERLRDLGWEDEIGFNESCKALLDERRVRKACEQDFTEKSLCDVVNYLNDYLEQLKEFRLSHSKPCHRRR